MTGESVGGARYDATRAAGISPVFRDGFMGTRALDVAAADAELWAAAQYGVTIATPNPSLRGDDGYDFVVNGIRVDVQYTRNRAPSYLLIKPYKKKLRGSDVLVLVTGPPFVFVGAIWTRRFKERAERKTFEFGETLAMRSADLLPVADVLGPPKGND